MGCIGWLAPAPEPLDCGLKHDVKTFRNYHDALGISDDDATAVNSGATDSLRKRLQRSSWASRPASLSPHQALPTSAHTQSSCFPFRAAGSGGRVWSRV